MNTRGAGDDLRPPAEEEIVTEKDGMVTVPLSGTSLAAVLSWCRTTASKSIRGPWPAPGRVHRPPRRRCHFPGAPKHDPFSRPGRTDSRDLPRRPDHREGRHAVSHTRRPLRGRGRATAGPPAHIRSGRAQAAACSSPEVHNHDRCPVKGAVAQAARARDRRTPGDDAWAPHRRPLPR